jgi:hypothetical protein
VYQKDHYRQLLRSRNSTIIENNTHLTNGRKVIKYLISKGAIVNENDFNYLPDTVFPLLKELLNSELIKQKFRTPINRSADPRLLTRHFGSKNEEPTDNSSLSENIRMNRTYRLINNPKLEYVFEGNNTEKLNTYLQGGPAVEGVGTRPKKRRNSRKSRKSRTSRKSRK